MKKRALRLLCLKLSVILMLNYYAHSGISIFETIPDFNIYEATAILKIEIFDACNEKYVFVLTPENVLLSQYNECRYGVGKIEQDITELTSWQLSMIEYYLDKTKKDISGRDCNGGALFSDYFYERMHINDEQIMFTYGTSESTSANLLTEIIIGCSNLKTLNSMFCDLKPTSYAYRQTSRMLKDFDT